MILSFSGFNKNVMLIATQYGIESLASFKYNSGHQGPKILQLYELYSKN